MENDRMRLPFALVAYLFFCWRALAMESDTTDKVYVRGIEIYGNKITRVSALEHFIAFDTGQVLDTSKLRITRQNLLETRIYDKVDIFARMREDGAHVFIVLKESARIRPLYGGEYYTRKYGRDELWYRLSFDVAIDNFRGRMEELSFGGGVWEYRSLNLLWYKPFLSTPYFISVGAGIDAYPEYNLPLYYTDVFANLSAGIKLGKYSKLSIGAIPIYRHREMAQSTVGEDYGEIDTFEKDQYEAFAAIGFSTDRRSHWFDPKSGWYFNSQLSTNRLYNGANPSFYQLTGEYRRYIPLLFGDVAAIRLRIALRDADAGEYHRLVYGGVGDVRGYNIQVLGWDFVANSSFQASIKYHKPIYESPTFPMPLANLVFGGGNEMHFRFDATFMIDYASLRAGPTDILLFRGRRQDGMGIGFGTRVVAPEIRQSACIDLVFGKIDGPNGVYSWEPALHLYLDVFF